MSSSRCKNSSHRSSGTKPLVRGPVRAAAEVPAAHLVGASLQRVGGGLPRTAAGCEQIFVDKASGKLARRPELDKALLVAHRRGDQLVVTKLDRLARSLEHLIDLSPNCRTAASTSSC